MPRIIVIDDEKEAVEALKRFFERRGMEIILADNVDDGVRLIREKKPDLVLLDLFLDGQSGLSVLRAFGHARCPCPVTILSGSIGDVDMDQAKGLGVEDFLLKPVSLEALKRHILKKLFIEERMEKNISHSKGEVP